MCLGRQRIQTGVKPEMKKADSTCQGEIGEERLRGKGLFRVLFYRQVAR